MAESCTGPSTRFLALSAIVLIAACSSGSPDSEHGTGGRGDDAGLAGSGGAVGDAGAQPGSGGAGSTGSLQGGSPARGGSTSPGGASGGRSGTTGSGGRSSGGAAGKTAAAGKGGAMVGAGGACMGVGTACDAEQPACCSGLVCVSSTGPEYAGCRESCETAADCASGCCIPFANIPDKGFCGSADLCQCAGLDETCGGARHCCDGFTCTTYDSTNRLACKPKCTKNADCDTNCCIAIPTTPDSACFMASWCGK